MAVVSFKCPNCDGELIFDPATQGYKCEYCFSSFTQAQLDAMQPEQSTKQAPQQASSYGAAEGGNTSGDGTGAVIYNCPSCGAEIVTDETTAATFCYYCHNPVVLGGRLEGEFFPDKIIPFEVTKEKAIQGFLDYVGKKKFVPTAFFRKKQIETMTGVYFPYWIYDVQFRGTMQADARKVRIWRTGDMEYKETKYYDVERKGFITIKNLTENALGKANAKLADGVMPYKFDMMKDFNMGYLSGFQAEKRDIERSAVEEKMQQEMQKNAETLMRDSINGYNTVNVRNSNFVPQKERWSYVLFPVWTITYKGSDGKIYYYSMNGQTGQVCGELPVDKKKLSITSLIVGAVVLILGLTGGFFL